MLAAAKSDAIGAIYAARAQEAVDANVIGSPCYVLDGEVFWGQDRLGLLGERAEERTQGRTGWMREMIPAEAMRYPRRAARCAAAMMAWQEQLGARR